MDPFIGEIRVFPYWFTPKGWLPCNGQLLAIAQNQALFALLGTRFGGDGKVNFALPNLQGRCAISTDYTTTLPIGASAGEATHTLTIDEIPAHTHALEAVQTPGTTGQPSSSVMIAQSRVSGRTPAPFNAFGQAPGTGVMSPTAVGVAGGSLAHDNMQPYLVMNYCIASAGLWPPHPW